MHFSLKRTTLVTLCLAGLVGSASAADQPPAMRVLSTPLGTQFGLFGEKPTFPAPTLFVFATSMDEMARLHVYTEAGRRLARHGWLYVTLDPPCHGRDHHDDEPAALSGWAHRIENGTEVVGPFTERCADVLDYLINQGYTDSGRVAASGTSRGGFCALHFAAADERVRAVAAVSPVTNLLALREFAGVRESRVRDLNVAELGSRLAGRAVWLSIGNDDRRVSTDDCVAAARRLMNAAGGAAVDLVVSPADGHRAIENAYALAAEFIRQQTAGPTANGNKVAEGPLGGSRTILFVDDHAILYRSGTTRVLHEPVRHARNPVIAETKPWELAIAYCSVYRHPNSGKHQLWYQAYAGGRADDSTRRVVVCYAESDDGIEWTKPDLGLFDFNGATETNIVLIGNGGRSVNYGAAVLVDPNDGDAARRYKMAYWDFVKQDDGDVPGLCVAFSPDGIHWTKHPDAPLLKAAYGVPSQPPFDGAAAGGPPIRPAISDVIDLMYDPVHEMFVIYAKTWIDSPKGNRFWKRAVVRTQSSDFIHWSAPQLVMAPLQSDSGQLHGAPVFYRHGVYFGLVQRLDFRGHDASGSGDMPAELALSRNGVDWQRPFKDTAFLPVATDRDAFDAGCLWTNAMPVFLDEAIRFYYGAYTGWNSDVESDNSGIGLATLPRNRFVGVEPIDRIGQITLKPLELDGRRRLTVNADAANGSIRVEVLTLGGCRLPGYTRDESLALHGDSLQHPVRWKSKTIADLPAGRYQLRLHLDNAEVFAITLGE